MADAVKKIAEPKTIANLTLTVTRGVSAGWIAGIPQVLVAQAVGHLLGIRERADVGPRFIRRAASIQAARYRQRCTGCWVASSTSSMLPCGVRPTRWRSSQSGRSASRPSSPADCSVGSSMPPPSRRWVELRAPARSASRGSGPSARQLVHCSAAWSFAFTTSFCYRWLRERW